MLGIVATTFRIPTAIMSPTPIDTVGQHVSISSHMCSLTLLSFRAGKGKRHPLSPIGIGKDGEATALWGSLNHEGQHPQFELQKHMKGFLSLYDPWYLWTQFSEKMWRFASKFAFDIRQPITRWNRNRRWEAGISETGIPERHCASVFQTFPAEMIMLSPQRAHLTATSEDLNFIDVFCRTSGSPQASRLRENYVKTM